MKKIEVLGVSRLKFVFHAAVLIACITVLFWAKPKQPNGLHVQGKESLVMAGLSVLVATEFATTAFPPLHPGS